MEKKITNWKFWVFLLTLNFGINAQNMITTTQCTSTAACDGTATVDPGMIGSANWNWQQDSVNILQSGGTTISNLCPGSYFLTYLDSLSNTVYISFYIEEPFNNPCDDSPITATYSTTVTTSPNTCDGTIVTTITSTQNYTFSWDNGLPNTINQDNLCSGTYQLTVTGTNGCVIAMNCFVATDTTATDPCANSSLYATFASVPSTDSVNCNGQIALNVSGGVLPYQYMMEGDTINNGSDFIDLCTGFYVFTVKDSLGCMITIDGFVPTDTTTSDPCANSSLYATVASIPSTDSVNCNGQIALNVSGGVLPYQYMMEGDTINNGPDFIDLCTGFYVFTVKDSLGCMITIDGFVPTDTTTSDPCANSNLSGTVTSVPSTDSVNCNGEVILNVSGGVLPYLYMMEGGTTNIDPGFVGLCAGVYIFTVQDSLGCMISLTGYVQGDSTTSTNPCANTMMYAQITTTNTSAQGICDGSISTSVEGGSGMYTYNWNNGATTSAIDNLCSDVYTVMVTDTNGCMVSATGYVATNFDSTFVMDLSGYVIPTGTSADGMCDGTASVIVYGGNAPYTFLFTDGGTNSTTANLCAGFQSVTVTDNAGTTMILDFLVSSPINVTETGNYNDSTLVDSVYNTAIPDCIINYSIIDSAFVSNFTILPNDSLFVTWSVVYGDSIVTITDYYGLGLGTSAGVYMVVLQIYCPGKSVGNYLTAYDQIYYNAAYAGINEQVNNEFMVYPNPFNDHILITLNDSQNTEVMITDMTGKEIFNSTINSTTNTIDLSALSAGQYIVTVKNGTSVMNRKIVK